KKKAKKKTIFMNVGNNNWWREGGIEEKEGGLTEGAWVGSRLGGPSSRSSIRLGRSLWQGRDASTEAEIVLLFRFPVTIPRRKKQSLNSLIGSASILLMPEQSLNRGGNNLDLPFTASIRRKRNFRRA